MKRLRWLALVLILCLIVPNAWAKTGYVDNGDFEMGAETLPDGWSVDQYDVSDVTDFAWEANGRGGGKCVRIENRAPNDARFIQTVSVSPSKIYRISGWVKVEEIPEGSIGASITALESVAEVPAVTRNGAGWQFVSFYGKTGPDQRTLTLACRLGGYGEETTGVAWFDDVELQGRLSAPEGETVYDLYTEEGSGESGASGTTKSMLPFQFLALLFGLLLVALWRLWLTGKGSSTNPGQRRERILLVGILLVGLAVRLAVAGVSEGYPQDISCFTAWSERVAQVGFWNFYSPDFFCDYPVGYLYVLWMVGLLRNLLGISLDGAAYQVLLRLPAILADLALAYLVWRMAKGRIPRKPALALVLVCAVNPAAILSSSGWGQMDSVMTLLLVLGIAALADRKFIRAAVWYALAVAVKPQAALLFPVFLFPAIKEIVQRNQGAWKNLLLYGLTGIGTFLVLFVPFWGNQGPFWILEKYLGTAGSYPYWSLNASNLYSLVGLDWVMMPETALGLPVNAWIAGLWLVISALSGIWYFRSKNREDIWLIAAFQVSAIFMALPMMHERYLAPAILLLVMAYVRRQERTAFWIMGVFSITQFLSSYMALTLVHVPRYDQWMIMLSAGTLIAFAALALMVNRVCGEGHVKPLRDDARDQRNEERRTRRAGAWLRRGMEPLPKYGKLDWLLMLSLTAVYAVVALVNLGSMKDPQTEWRPAVSNEAVTIDLGAVRDVDRITYFTGIGSGRLLLELSDDGVEFHRVNEEQFDHASVFKWQRYDINDAGRYLRIVSADGIIALREVGVQADGEWLAIEPDETNAALLDEQDTIPERPGYENSTYFDEIYHARTAYEHLNGIVPYENTHPPLGKVFIMIGVWIFGMVPFGWRIVGTLFGVAMIPAIYAFARAIFRKTWVAFAAALLLAVDFMHFTQTRIATIDVYGVFFIIMMFYFMYRYTQTNYLCQGLKQPLKYLFLSGLMFGLGAASKWIVLYGGAGLAVLFFWTLYQRYTEYRWAKERLPGAGGEEREKLQAAVNAFWPGTIKILACCVLFFIAIPVGIYVASYLPTILIPGQGLSYVWRNQQSMFSYHAGLESTHPFESPWWQWPVIARPIWFFVNNYLAPGLRSTIVSMGNPAVWWGGLVALILAARHWLKSDSLEDEDGGWSRRVIVLALVSQYVPWMLVSRCTFIYHYFACVPFLVLTLAWMMNYWTKGHPKRMKWVYAYLAVAAALFIWFYPALSGLTVPEGWIASLRWLPSWTF